MNNNNQMYWLDVMAWDKSLAGWHRLQPSGWWTDGRDINTNLQAELNGVNAPAIIKLAWSDQLWLSFSTLNQNQNNNYWTWQF